MTRKPAFWAVFVIVAVSVFLLVLIKLAGKHWKDQKSEIGFHNA